MARMLLLDDSPVMHRVVRLTFADDPRMEIAVARTPSEADQNLAAGQVDLIISYVRFGGMIDARYFEALSFVSPRILLLAESEENLEDFTRAGFNSVLRKPFHSDELRQVVEEMLLKEAVPRVSEPPLPRTAPVPPSQPSVSAPARAPTPPPAAARAPTPPPAAARAPTPPPAAARAPTPPPAEARAPTPPPAAARAPTPPPAVSPQPPQFDLGKIADAGEDTVDFSSKASSKSGLKGPVGTTTSEPSSSAKWNEPQITMDLSFFQTAASGKNEVVANPSFDSTDTQFGGEETTAGMLQQLEVEKPTSASRASASAEKSPRAVEPSPWNADPMTLEDVMVSTRVAPAGGTSRQEIEKIVEDAVAVAVTKAVRQALNETIPDLRQGLVNEVSQRAVDQLSAELHSIKKTLRENMLVEIRDVSAQWLRRETPNLAKDVIREEIRKVIEGI